VKQVFVATKNVARFRDAMAVLMDTAKGQPGFGVAHGRAGRGKTMAARNLHAERGGHYLRVWQDWSQHAFLQGLAFEVAGMRPHGANRCKATIIDALGRDPRPIYVDEADRLAAGRIEDLRDIHDETGAAVMLVGEEALYATLNARRRLWSRVTQEVQFGPVADEDVLTFALQAAGLKLDAEACRQVAQRAGGDFRLVARIVGQLERMAKASETNRATAEMVARVQGVGL